MENTKTQVIILEHEDKTSKGFDYTRFKCQYSDQSIKWMSSFKKTDAEKQCVQDLKDSEGKLVSIEICNPKDDLWNIKKFCGIVPKEFANDSTPMQKDIDQEHQGNFAGAPVQTTEVPANTQKVESKENIVYTERLNIARHSVGWAIELGKKTPEAIKLTAAQLMQIVASLGSE